MNPVLQINGHDYSRFIASKSFGWSRNDLDTDETKRTKDGLLRRYKITTKRKLTFKTIPMSRENMAQLDFDLSESTFCATYSDLHGVQSRTFYCSSFTTSLIEITDDYESWAEASFNLIEV